MKTFFQKVILFLYGWRIHNTIYRTQDYYTGDLTTGYYPMMYKKGYNSGNGYRYHPVDLAWMKQFGYKASKRVTFAIILGDLVIFGLGIWFIVWLALSLYKGF